MIVQEWENLSIELKEIRESVKRIIRLLKKVRANRTPSAAKAPPKPLKAPI